MRLAARHVFVAATALLTGCAANVAEPPGLDQTYQRPSAHGTVVASGQCASGTFAETLQRAVVEGNDIVFGEVRPTGKVVTRQLPAGSLEGERPMSYTELEGSFERLNSHDRFSGKVYVVGGTGDGGAATDIGSEMQSAWSASGGVFGLVIADPDIGYVMTSVPATDSAVLFPALGCWNVDDIAKGTQETKFDLVSAGGIESVERPAASVPVEVIRSLVP